MQDCILLKPLTFMNLSGAAVRDAFDFYKLMPADVLVDLHTFSAPGEPFVFFGPADNQEELEPFRRSADGLRQALFLGRA